MIYLVNVFKDVPGSKPLATFNKTTSRQYHTSAVPLCLSFLWKSLIHSAGNTGAKMYIKTLFDRGNFKSRLECC